MTSTVRYAHLCSKLNATGVLHDLDDPNDRAIVDVTLTPDETLELLRLHDNRKEEEQCTSRIRNT